MTNYTIQIETTEEDDLPTVLLMIADRVRKKKAGPEIATSLAQTAALRWAVSGSVSDD